MPLVMQLDGLRASPQSPQLLGLWSDIIDGIQSVGDAFADAAADAWTSVTDRRVALAKRQINTATGVHGSFGMVIPDFINNPLLVFVLGAGVGIFLATRKGKR